MKSQQLFKHASNLNTSFEDNSTSYLQNAEHCKKIGLETFKGWDSDIKHNLTVTKGILDSVLLWLQSAISTSNDRTKKVHNFFDKIQFSFTSETSSKDFVQMFDFKKQVRTQSRRIVLENHDVRDILQNFSEEFNELLSAAKVTETAINESIAKQILKNELTPHQENLCLFLATVLSTKKMIDKSLVTLENEFDNLTKIFRRNPFTKSGQRKDQKSLFDQSLSYFYQIEKVVRDIKEYGFMVVKLFEDTKSLENLKFKAFKNAFGTFIESISDLFGSRKDKYFSLSYFLLEKMNEMAVTNFVIDMNEALQPSQIELLLKKCQLENFDPFALKVFVEQLRADNFDPILDLLIVFKEPGILIEDKRNSKKVSLFATIDNFYSLHQESLNSTKSEILMTCPSELVNFKETNNPNSLTLIFRTKKLFWEEVERFLVTFPNQVVDNILIHHEKNFTKLGRRLAIAGTKKKDPSFVGDVSTQGSIREFKKTLVSENTEEDSLNFSSESDFFMHDKKAAEIIFDNEDEF